MSVPKIPERTSLTREDVINQIIASIAMEELGLSHIINAEGEKLQYALGTLEGARGPEVPASIEDLLNLNSSIRETLDSTMQNQMFLKAKLHSALTASVMQGPTGPQGPQGPATIAIDPDVDPLEPGASPTVKNVGTGDQNVILHFGIPAGATGAVGATGPTGATGSQGATGATGAAGASILNSYDNWDDFIKAHPSGTIGDAYLVDGELYVWGGDPASWQNMGSLVGPIGPTGSTGAAGATILNSYDNWEDFIKDHPSGTEGDAYLVDGELYVWGGDPESWQNMGSLVGPTGSTGAAGTAILDSYDKWDDFIKDHATGTKGDAYLVGGVLYVWGGEPASWQNMGSLVGPAGAGIGLIPFATGAGAVGLLDSRNGFATNVIFAGFGSSSKVVSKTGDGFTLPPRDGYFLPISLAHDITIKSIYFTTANYDTFTPPTGSTITPYIILAVAKQGETTFTFLQDTRTEVTIPWIGGTEIPTNSTVYGSHVNINQTISAGTRLAICCAFDMKDGNPPVLPVQGYYFYYAGSIYYE